MEHGPAIRLSAADLAIFAIYIVAVIGLGLYAARHAGRSKRDYFLAGDALPWWMVGGSIMAANISSHHFVGIMGVAYQRGFAAMNLAWPSVLYCFGALLWIFLPFYLRNGFYTMPEFLNRRYGTGARLVYAFLIVLTYIFVEISAVLYMGALAVNALLGWSIVGSIVALAVLTSVYTITGGLKSVVWTEMVQLGVLIVGGTALTIMTVRAVGGLEGVFAHSHEWDLLLPSTDPDFPWTMFIGASLGIGIFYGATNQFMVQRALAARNEWHARMGVVFASFLNLLMPLFYILPGVLAVQLFPDLPKADYAFPTLVRNLLPVGLIGLVMAGLVAAVMSHIAGSINSCVTIVCMDFYLPYVRKNASEREAVWFSKAFGVVVALVAIGWAILMIAHSDRPVFIYLLNIYGYFAPGITTMFLVGIFWRGMTHAGALAAGLLTIPLSALLEALWPDMPFMNRTGIVFWICVVTAVVVSLFTQPKPKEELKGMIWNPESLQLPPEERHLSRGLRSPALWYGAVLAVLLFLYIKYG